MQLNIRIQLNKIAVWRFLHAALLIFGLYYEKRTNELQTNLLLLRRRERVQFWQLVRSRDVASAQLTFSSLSLLDPLILNIDISLMKLNFISRLNSALLSKLGHLWGNDILHCILSTLIPGNKSHLNSYFLRKNTENQYTIDAQNSCFDELNL